MDFEYSNSELLDLATAGDKDAQFTLAYRYENGIGFDVSLAKAYVWAYVTAPYSKNMFLKRISNQLTGSSELHSARLFAMKLERIINS